MFETFTTSFTFKLFITNLTFEFYQECYVEKFSRLKFLLQITLLTFTIRNKTENFQFISESQYVDLRDKIATGINTKELCQRNRNQYKTALN